MGWLDLFGSPDINEGVARFSQKTGAVLLDVRNPQEYAAGHIPGSRNIPLGELELALREIPLDSPLYVYCLSGGRSRQAASLLRQMGYRKVHDIGGINSYRGKLEG